MKNSGIEWIGEIPDSWKLERLQWHMFEIKEQNTPVKTMQVLSLTNKLGVVPYEQKGEQGNKSKENYEEYKIAYPQTIVANSMNILIGSVGICNYLGCVSPVYYVFKPLENENIEYLNYVFQLTEFQKELRKYASGILEIRLRLAASDILKQEVAFPSKAEQKKIVEYLHQKLSNVDKLIDIQQAQIDKLKEYKQSVITKAVTKGLDPTVPMKDSGVEWIGMIPINWNIQRAKYISTSLVKGNGITKQDIVIGGDTPCIRYGEIYTKYNISFDVCKTRTNKEKLCTLQFFHYGDILFACTGELVEEIGKNVVYLGNQVCLAGGDIIIMSHNQCPSFLNYSLYASCSQVQKSCGKAKLKVVHISASEIGNILIALPNKELQQRIADYLDDKCAKIDKLIAIKQAKIDKLQEYKKSLIYEYVTGKKEVM